MGIIDYNHGSHCMRQHQIVEVAKSKGPRYAYWCPLVEAKIDRESCKAIIRNAGLPVPRKSACWFCPASKFDEVRRLQIERPDLVRAAVDLEVNAAQGKHGLGTTKGLGRNWSWLERLAEISPSFERQYAAELEVVQSHR